MNQRQLGLIKDVIQRDIDAGVLAGASVLVHQSGWEQFYCQAGMADREQKKPIERDSIFRLYSMSKPITGAALMLLMDRGMVDIHDPVSRYLPGFENQVVHAPDGTVPAVRAVTLKDLLGMVSGLPYWDENLAKECKLDKLLSPEELRHFVEDDLDTVETANLLGKAGLLFQPGESYRYGTSTDIIGAVVEVAAGKRFGQFLKDEFFDPLGMPDTGFFIDPSKAGRLANVYRETPQGLELYEADHLGVLNKPFSSPAYESGGGGLLSTLDDYMKFATMLLQEGSFGTTRILSPAAVEYFTEPQLDDVQLAAFHKDMPHHNGYNYANFLRIMTEPGKAILNGSHGEYGWDGWLGCYFMNDPVNEMTILVMMQKVDAGTIPMTRKVRNLIFSAID